MDNKDVLYIVHEGMNPQEIFPLIDELVTATMVYNPRLYRAFMRKLTNK